MLNVCLTYAARYKSSGGVYASTCVDKEFVDKLGDGSVYHFFLGKSWRGWFIALCTATAQLYVFFAFVEGSETFSSDGEDKEKLKAFTWVCPRDKEECGNTDLISHRGWVVFGIMMTTYLLKDFVYGSKLINLVHFKSKDSNLYEKIRWFFGGTIWVSVTAFAFYASTIYNQAIATSNTELIMNS